MTYELGLLSGSHEAIGKPRLIDAIDSQLVESFTSYTWLGSSSNLLLNIQTKLMCIISLLRKCSNRIDTAHITQIAIEITT